MKRIFILLAFIAMMLPAYSWVRINGLYYNLDTYMMTAEVTYNQNGVNDNYVKGSLTIPETVEYNGGTYTVTSIGENAFWYCTGLTSVEIPNSVTSIGNYAFQHCWIMANVNIPNSVTSIGGGAFQDCRELYYVEIPNSVTSIEAGTFAQCWGLNQIVIPNSVTSIGSNAFRGCSDLRQVVIFDLESWCKIDFGNEEANPIFYAHHLILFDEKTFDFEYIISLSIPPTLNEIKDYTFYGYQSLTSVEIPNSVNTIGNYTFYDCQNLTSIVIPNSVTSIGEGAFSGCTGLISVVIPNSVTSIGDEAFSGCSGLTSVEIPNSVTSIGTSTFSGCSGLTSVEIPNSVTSIGDDAFKSCSSLTSVEIPNSVTSIANKAFSGCPIESLNINCKTISNWFKGYKTLKNLIFGNSVTSIDDDAFKGCTGLTSIEIPNSVTSIGTSAFEDCTALTSVVIGNSVTFIGGGAFWNCPVETLSINCPLSLKNFRINTNKIKKLIIGKSVPSIDIEVFSKHELTDIVLESETPPGYYSAFSKWAQKATLTIPDSADIRDYLSSDWNDFLSIKQANGDKIYLAKDGIFEYRFIESLGKAYLSKFYGPSTMTYVTLPDQVVGDRKGEETYYPVTGMSIDAFRECTNLSLVIIPESYEFIGRGAFMDCSGLTSIDIPTSVTLIGRDAFSGCSSLTSIEIPNSVTTIGRSVFNGCSGLTSMRIPNSVTYMGTNVFQNCEFDYFSLDDGVEELPWNDENSIVTKNLYFGRPINGNITFSGLESLEVSGFIESVPVDRFNNNANLQSITINPGSGIVIEDGAFFGCTNLSDLTLPEDIARIGANAFRGTAIKNLTVPNGMIGANAFANCNLDNIIIGAGVESIGDKAFDGSNAIKNVSATPTTPPAATNTTFSSYTASLYVPSAAINAYSSSTCWSRFSGKPLVMPESIEVSGPTTISGKAGETIQLSATISPSNVSLDRVLWNSTNPALASVDNNGLVTIHNMISEEEKTKVPPTVSCQIIASTLYADSTVAIVTINTDPEGTAIVYEIPDEFGCVGESAGAPNDIYTMQGVCVKRNAVQSDIDALAPGIYIVAGKKIIVR